jgi:hypothetical protein
LGSIITNLSPTLETKVNKNNHSHSQNLHQEQDKYLPKEKGEYFKNILKDAYHENQRVIIKYLDPNNKLIEDMINNKSNSPVQRGNINLSSSKGNNFFITNVNKNTIRRISLKGTLVDKKLSMKRIGENLFKKNSVFIPISNKSRKKSTERINIVPFNRNIIENNNDKKVVFYAPAGKRRNISYNDIITESISKNCDQMASNRAKIKMIQQDNTYRRIKVLEGRLPRILDVETLKTQEENVNINTIEDLKVEKVVAHRISYLPHLQSINI